MSYSPYRKGFVILLGLLVLSAGVVFFLLRFQDKATPETAPEPRRDDDPAASEQEHQAAADEQVETYEPDAWNVALVGTVVAKPRKWSTATIVDRNTGESGEYRIGDRLPGGARLVAIRSDRVVLKRRGERRVLFLSDGVRQATAPTRSGEEPEKESEPGPVDSEEQAPDEDWPAFIPQDMVRRLGEGSYRIDRESLDRLLARPGDVLRVCLFTLAFDDSGRMQGVRLAIGPEGNVYRRLGLKSGDVIHRIGPVVLDSPESLVDIEGQLEQAVVLDVELDRGGRRMTLRYKIE